VKLRGKTTNCYDNERENDILAPDEQKNARENDKGETGYILKCEGKRQLHMILGAKTTSCLVVCQN
jgi:hypothetical protein